MNLASFSLGLSLVAALTACADPPKPAPTPEPPPVAKPPALFDGLPVGSPWPKPMGETEPPPPAEIPSTLEGTPVTLRPRAACKSTVAIAAADVSFPVGSEDGITAAVAYGKRLEARFLREGFTDSAAGVSVLEDGLFRGKAEGTYQSSFGWNERVRTLRVHCVKDKCDVTVTEAVNACPDGSPQRKVGETPPPGQAR